MSLNAALCASRTNRRAPGTPTIMLMSSAALLFLIAIVAAWYWQRSPAESAPSEVAISGEAPLAAIAVLPFDDLSPNGDHAWLANGMAEDLIEALSRIKGLHVPARRSTAIVKRSGADLPTIGERLEVGTVVEGSVRRIGGELSVLARWIRVRDGKSLWSARFDRPFDDVLEIQKEISVGIAEAIRTELGIQDALALLLSERYETSDIRAWELLKKAVPLAETLKPANIADAREMLLRAIDYDPKYLAAHSQLGILESREDIDKGLDRYKKILRMDPSNRAVLAGFAWDSAMRYWDYQTAEELLRRIPKDQQTAQTLEIDYWVFANTGRLKEALAAAQRSVQLDPMWGRSHCHVGYVQSAEGEWASAVNSYQTALSLAEDTGQWGATCASALAETYHLLGRESEAVQTFVHYLPSSSRQAAMRGWETGGWAGMNRAIINADAALGGGSGCAHWLFARAGAVERLYECLEGEIGENDTTNLGSSFSLTVRNSFLGAIAWQKKYAPYRNQPRFQKLLRRRNERMKRAAGTYERKLGFELPQSSHGNG